MRRTATPLPFFLFPVVAVFLACGNPAPRLDASAADAGGDATNASSAPVEAGTDAGETDAEPKDAAQDVDTCTPNVPCAPPVSCHNGTTACATGAKVCTDVGGNTCTDGGVCEVYGAACADPSWAEWPLPNSAAEVNAGAPNLQSYSVGTGALAGTVTDNVTKLMWQQAPSSATITWPNAAPYCETLTLAGYRDWRLPTVVELQSIVDYGSLNPAIDATAFPGTPYANIAYWTSTAEGPSMSMCINFGGGSVSPCVTGPAYPQAVRCVR